MEARAEALVDIVSEIAPATVRQVFLGGQKAVIDALKGLGL